MRTRNPNNDHKKVTPKTSGANRKDDKKFTSYDTTKAETSTPQKVRETNESTGEHLREKKAKDKGR